MKLAATLLTGDYQWCQVKKHYDGEVVLCSQGKTLAEPDDHDGHDAPDASDDPYGHDDPDDPDDP